jgi:hypothetical protein
MPITASQLRQNVYRVLDQVLETGEPAEIERRGRRLRIVSADPGTKLGRLVRRPSCLRVLETQPAQNETRFRIGNSCGLSGVADADGVGAATDARHLLD